MQDTSWALPPSMLKKHHERIPTGVLVTPTGSCLFNIHSYTRQLEREAPTTIQSEFFFLNVSFSLMGKKRKGREGQNSQLGDTSRGTARRAGSVPVSRSQRATRSPRGTWS